MDDIVAYPGGSLSSLDWKVVDLARRDGRRSLLPPGRIARLARPLFGWPIASPLANPRLEALRRFCVRAWHWNLIRIHDMLLVSDMGYSIADLCAILAHVARRRGFAPRILRHNSSDRDWSAVSPRSLAFSPALPAPRCPPRCGQSPHRQASLMR